MAILYAWVRHVDLVRLAVLTDAHSLIDLPVVFFCGEGATG